MPETRQDLLHDAMTDLQNSVGNYGKSGTFIKMENALRDLSVCIDQYYGKNGENPPILKEANLKELKVAYIKALQACMDYTEGKGDSRHSGYGTARLRSALAIEEILWKDYMTLRELEPEKMSLPMALGDARITDVQLDAEEKDLVLAGANSSVRIPIAMETELGTAEGYFTEDTTVLSDEEILQELEDKYGHNELLGRILDKGKTDGMFVGERAGNHLAALGNIMRNLEASEGDNLPNTINDCIESDRVFNLRFRSAIYDLLGGSDKEGAKETLNAIISSRENRKAFLDMLADAREQSRESQMNKNRVGIPEGENIPNRNVGMSRVADLLGIGDVIARAERIKITDKEGNVREGVFQETAKGSDPHHLKKNDPLYAISRHPEIMDDGHFMKQLADLQVLDYICGNTDRHVGNIMFETEVDENGKVRIKNIKGIDNDRAFGKMDAQTLYNLKTYNNGFYITLPDDMGVISSSTAKAIKELNRDQLALALKDLNFSDEVIDSCMKRAQEIQKAIDEKKIWVIDDENFDYQKFRNLRVNLKPEDELQSRTNIFERLSGLKYIGEVPPMAEKETVYNRAKAQAKQYEKAEKPPVKVKDLEKMHADLVRIRADFKANDIKVHVDGGTFKWMKNSLNDSIKVLNELRDKYGDGQKVLNEKDAKKLDGVLRQLSKASKEYVRTHPNPKHTMGRVRTAGARQMQNLDKYRLIEPEEKVKDLGFNEAALKIIGENGQKKEEKKKKVHRITKASVRAAGQNYGQGPNKSQQVK